MMCVNTPVITGVFTHVAEGKARGGGAEREELEPGGGVRGWGW